MKTFILFWNPAISSWKLEHCTYAIDHGYLFDLNWSVWEHEEAHRHDRFYMVRCGEGNTGICMSGWFDSDPYRGEDWSGKGREVYYCDLYIDAIIDTEHCPILSTEELQRELPDFDWTGGHSGRILPAEYEKRLDELWWNFHGKHEEMFHRRALWRRGEDGDDPDFDDD